MWPRDFQTTKPITFSFIHKTNHIFIYTHYAFLIKINLTNKFKITSILKQKPCHFGFKFLSDFLPSSIHQKAQLFCVLKHVFKQTQSQKIK